MPGDGFENRFETGIIREPMKTESPLKTGAGTGKKDQGRKPPDGYSLWFVLIVTIFITCLITANIIAVKIVTIGGLVMPAGVIIFPLSYVFGDVLTEVYGYRKARRVIWLGFLCNLLAVVAIYLTQILPPVPFWDGQGAYERILGFTPRLLFASFVAYLMGEFANSFVLAKMKIATRGRWLWTRTIGSTLVGEGLDSIVFTVLAFAGVMPAPVLISAAANQWLVKSVYEAVVTPVTYKVVNFLKRKEHIDTFDYDTRFNPLLLTE
jgi:queuosine precursor transporter